MSEKRYKASILAKKDQFIDYQDVINALYDKDEKVSVSELKAKLKAHLGRRVK